MQVHFALQDGFSNDDVVVRVDGREVIRESNLKGADPLLPVAALHDVEVQRDTGQVSIEVPTRGLSRSFDLDFEESPYLGIAIVEGEIALRRSSRPFEYA
jgi:hypothetical protein